MDVSLDNEKQMNNIRFTLSLLSSVINETEPKEPDFQPDWEFIFRFTKSHKVDNTVFYAIEKLNNKPEPTLYKKWMDARNKCIHRNMIQRQEFASICATFEEKGIEYMPVKGFAVSELYPKEDMRYMGDLDILIKDRREEAINILLNNGYSVKEKGIDYDKPLIKPPFMVVELHNNLFPLYSPYRSLFGNVFSKSTKINCYHKMSPEDFYIYETVHFYKHYSGSGAGIRNIIDFYFINKTILPESNKEKINKELTKLELYDFSRTIAKMADKWFKSNDYRDFCDDELLVLSSGLYGTKDKRIQNITKTQSKSKYLFTRLFPSKERMYEFFPKLQKHPVLLPFYYIFRLFRGLFTRIPVIINEIRILKKNGNK